MAIYCTNCGKQLPDDALFCDNCGTRVGAPQYNNNYQQYPQYQQPIQNQFQGMQTVQPYQNDPFPTKKKQSSFLGKVLKFFVALAVVFALVFGAIVFLEKVYHRTPPATDPQSNVQPGTSGSSSDKPASSDTSPSPSGQTPADDVPQGILTPDGDAWFDDFLFYENDVYDNGIPDGAALQSAGYISGQWKYCMTFNRTIPGEERIDEVGLAEISFTEDTATLILHPQYIRYGTHVDPETDEEVGYEPFTGTWDNEYIDLMGNGSSVGLGPYYSYNGKDYVLGNIVVKQSGLFGDLLLVRP
ncbi:MAG: zinc ribbon domain-containing protein [Oscillospiraceae bacterium]|nr:zinc ribbon domain-containing protein [Oscillospiraceae bacterium]